MKHVTATEANRHFGKVLATVEAGEEGHFQARQTDRGFRLETG